jgi:uncharacterized protein (DUF1499 family)
MSSHVPPRARPPPARRALSSARRRRSAPLLLAAAVTAAAAVAALYSTGMLASVSEALSRPILNDVSTDLDSPPQFLSLPPSVSGGGGPGPVPLPEEFKPQIRRAYPGLKPLVTIAAGGPAGVFAALERLARSRAGWEVVAADDKAAEGGALALQGVATTRLLRFRDDFVFRVKASDGGGSVIVDGRSRSRLGRGDLGANAARVEGFLADLEKELSA